MMFVLHLSSAWSAAAFVGIMLTLDFDVNPSRKISIRHEARLFCRHCHVVDVSLMLRLEEREGSCACIGTICLGFGLVTGFIGLLQHVITIHYGATANSRTLQFTTARKECSRSAFSW
jgi:hypothetical protein